MTPASHILVFTLAYDPYVGGAEIALKEIMRRLPKVHFTVITARALKNFRRQSLRETEERGNIRIVRVGSRGRMRGQYGYPFAAVRRAFREARFQKPDMVWGMMESYGGIAASMFHQKFGAIPYLLTMQSGDTDRFWALRTWFWMPWYRKIFRKAAAVQAISSYLASRAQKFGAREVEVIPNGVDLENFSNKFSPDTRQQLRAQWGIGSEDFVVMTTSRLVEKNGVDTLIKGFALWRRMCPEQAASLMIVGKGPQGTLLKRLAAREGIEKEVKFLGEIPNVALPPYYHSADVFVRPSRSEGLGISFLEAMSAGIPIIGTPVGGITDFLRDSVTGLVVQPGDAHSVANAIEQIRGDKDLRQRVTKNGKELAQEKYSWDAIAEEMGMLFERVVTENKYK